MVTYRRDACADRRRIAFTSSPNIIEREDLVEGTVDDLLVSAAIDYADLHGQEARLAEARHGDSSSYVRAPLSTLIP